MDDHEDLLHDVIRGPLVDAEPPNASPYEIDIAQVNVVEVHCRHPSPLAARESDFQPKKSPRA